MADVYQIVTVSGRQSAPDRVTSLSNRFETIRHQTLQLSASLTAEYQAIQSMTDVSPTRWHLAHTTWFFETFFLKAAWPEYPPDPRYAELFNSYYLTVGTPFPRSQRGTLSRPTVSEILTYRDEVSQRVLEGLQRRDERLVALLDVLELGLNHEQQHQELILTDIKHVLAQNPLKPRYHDVRVSPRKQEGVGLSWVSFDEGLAEVGWSESAFSFDNERPRHRVFLESFQLATRPVTNLEYLEFMADQGYAKSSLWLSDGWSWVQENKIGAPLYWFLKEGQWWHYTLSGVRPVELQEPVVHVSYYEADAFARWAGVRLPREEEWEVAAATQPVIGNFLESGCYHPQATTEKGQPFTQLFGDVWEWSQSPYTAYPGYRPLEKSLGEYNGKFMCNQMVLRGGSCVTPQSHVRATYRNFFYPHQRWQFMGIRLAKDRLVRSGS